MKKVCVIIPAYNEGKVIKNVILEAKKVFKKSSYNIDIVLINDGSRDNTSQEARESGAIVIDHILNSGAGGATSTGLLYAFKNNYEIAATMDADGQHAPEDVLAGIEFLDKNNIGLAIGSRLVNSEGMSKIKIIGNIGLSFITFILFGVKIQDSQSGLRVFSQEAIANLKWKSTGYEFCSEMIWRANLANLSIEEYPIKAIYTDYSKAKGQNNWNAINIVKKLIKQRVMEIMR